MVENLLIDRETFIKGYNRLVECSESIGELLELNVQGRSTLEKKYLADALKFNVLGFMSLTRILVVLLSEANGVPSNGVHLKSSLEGLLNSGLFTEEDVECISNLDSLEVKFLLGEGNDSSYLEYVKVVNDSIEHIINLCARILVKAQDEK